MKQKSIGAYAGKRIGKIYTDIVYVFYYAINSVKSEENKADSDVLR